MCIHNDDEKKFSGYKINRKDSHEIREFELKAICHSNWKIQFLQVLNSILPFEQKNNVRNL